MALSLTAAHGNADRPRVPAGDVARGVIRLFADMDAFGVREMPLANGRRADLIFVERGGGIVIVEIKVSRADLLGDGKWPDYLDYCDRFFWALPPGLDSAPLDDPARMPDRAGLLVADGYGAAVVREAAVNRLDAVRRKALVLQLSRIAARRLSALHDPDHALLRESGDA